MIEAKVAYENLKQKIDFYQKARNILTFNYTSITAKNKTLPSDLSAKLSSIKKIGLKNFETNTTAMTQEEQLNKEIKFDEENKGVSNAIKDFIFLENEHDKMAKNISSLQAESQSLLTNYTQAKTNFTNAVNLCKSAQAIDNYDSLVSIVSDNKYNHQIKIGLQVVQRIYDAAVPHFKKLMIEDSEIESDNFVVPGLTIVNPTFDDYKKYAETIKSFNDKLSKRTTKLSKEAERVKYEVFSVSRYSEKNQEIYEIHMMNYYLSSEINIFIFNWKDGLAMAKTQQKTKPKLPIHSAKNTIISEIQNNKSIILVGETGSGKTTQESRRYLLRIELLKKWEKKWVARFEDVTSSDTRLQFMTDGMLLRAILADPMLSQYSHVVLDEAHERTVRGDVLFGLVKNIQEKRKDDFKIVIMSATINAEKFSKYFDDAKILYVAGRMYPVEINYTEEPTPNYLNAALVTILQIHEEMPPGDVLVFLTGQEDIVSAQTILENHAKHAEERGLGKLFVCPIYSSMPTSAQNLVFKKTPEGSRKIVLATNIAETSITIPGIRYVVDSGLAKIRGFHPKLGIESLLTQQISRASARQRSGRAGRMREGICFRLYPENVFFDLLEEETTPEIMRCSVTEIVLLLKAMKVDDPLTFDFIDRPPLDSMKKALKELYALSALDDKGNLTKLGEKMSKFPLDAKLAKVLLTSTDVSIIIDVVSLLSVENIFFTPSTRDEHLKEKVLANRAIFASPTGDHITLLNAFYSYLKNRKDPNWCEMNCINKKSMDQVLVIYCYLLYKKIRKQLVDISKRLGLEVSENSDRNSIDKESILKCFLAGFFNNTAFLQADGSYSTLMNNTTVFIHPSSVLVGKKPACVTFNELVLTSKCYMRGISVIEPDWITQVAPHVFSRIRFGSSVN
ncbi:P-loop containing nucleoside triphosphate hydrolase protein [Rozella allomycis CSF55]|uniref:RNA helicase n=1 Tax=Rozella allomycis (strain CSF55) TaxID=988480 RepID=A0A4P9YKK7_ROZAC|nr:P-loop containing nucleoside triphosphate hydrolase protein [Rozella allomycis CSF55]